jgi:hypothetical protein
MLVHIKNASFFPRQIDANIKIYRSHLQRTNEGRHAGRWFDARARQCATASLLIGGGALMY